MKSHQIKSKHIETKQIESYEITQKNGNVIITSRMKLLIVGGIFLLNAAAMFLGCLFDQHAIEYSI
jgi:hypothetical protein